MGSARPEGTRWRRRAVLAHNAVASATSEEAGQSGARAARRRIAQRVGLATLALGGMGWVLVTLAQTHLDGAAFSRRLQAGCDEVAACRVLEAQAEARLDGCGLFCGGAAADYRAARLLRYRSEERRAVREHYRERERAERLAEEHEHAQKLDERQRREAARAEDAARAHRQRLELERLRQAHIDRRASEQRQRRAVYYAALGADGRERRLRLCLASAARCDALVLDLFDAAKDDAERRRLAQLNEGVAPAPKRERAGDKAARPPTPAPADTTPGVAPAASNPPAAPADEPAAATRSEGTTIHANERASTPSSPRAGA